MTTACIVQARLGSTRFPGKVLAALAGKPVLAHVIERCTRIPGVDLVVAAVPQEDMQALAPVALVAGATMAYGGSETDVLGRYAAAAEKAKADVIVRITADCPLIDPVVCGYVMRAWDRASAEYASNVHPRTWPQGLDCEVFTREALALAHGEAIDPYDREHATPWMVRAPEVQRVNVTGINGRPGMAHLRWTLDYPEDLAFFRALYEHGDPKDLNATLAILDKFPHLAEINAMHGVAA